MSSAEILQANFHPATGLLGIEMKTYAVVLRGALGGALGGFILLLISLFSSIGNISYPHLYLLAIPVALVLGGVMGTIVGTAVWSLCLLSGRQFGLTGRGIIGFVIALITLVLFAFIPREEPQIAYEPLSWTQHLMKWGVACLVLGALPGLMASQKARATLT